ncbi:UDP-3-O-(3-hydroxymyristoyl)glucosamine N-acyltransferase [Prosthecochloris sp. N3]|uniref:UDP-3-O-acylglucosamine N-acyltransferase n=1 Tax=Prosthecochloris ethylica TaxID=2743976 RepID=A0ABR9XQF2_9CHLB|nr:UDP-3-O-(3-hydroxymyristoyl)glucosamine N-acyltransferase [Prosthecochloris ethylica]MBF0585496.1 UDP-3-O-(3-hydroxymyristoyl)glucosamine N-acyltransferase [Prosthecochloris ethylica]MBF0636282.1 UDP-3-O-(3-hydroxymyristoyl)glucosamine N-acyltransferase [Prosthecochloris ethylica]NUK46726.1 UDP-3-O-(3-hydroxymyristoyl)glucosamine N-acyltransferase [Prosthecochloris ethylica]
MKVYDLQRYLKQFFEEVELVGDGDIVITRPAKIEEAGEGEVSFVANEKYRKYIGSTGASLLVVGQQITPDQYSKRCAFLKVKDPYTAFVFLLEKFASSPAPAAPGIASTAVVGKHVELGSNVAVGEYAVIGDGCRIGDNCIVGAHSVLLSGVSLGEGCLLFPHVVCYHGVRLGNRVTVHSGAVVGSDGFGFAPQADGSYIKIPQVGVVEVGDDVEIGSNTSIDRATMGSTSIGDGSKIDNLVQIAHNCHIGRHTVVAAQAGISGSVSIGSNCMIGGQAGFAGHLSIADRTHVAAQSGISKSVTSSGQAYRGYPAQPLREQLRQEVLVRNLGAMKARLDALEAELEKLRDVQ